MGIFFKACVKGLILFQKEGRVLWQLTVELNCIFFFRCDLDKQMFSQQIFMLSSVLGISGVQVYKTKQLLKLCPWAEVWSLMSICWTDTWPGTKAWLWSTLKQNSDCVFQEQVHFMNRSVVREALTGLRLVSSCRFSQAQLMGSDWCISLRFKTATFDNACSGLQWNGLRHWTGAANLKWFGQLSPVEGGVSGH